MSVPDHPPPPWGAAPARPWPRRSFTDFKWAMGAEGPGNGWTQAATDVAETAARHVRGGLPPAILQPRLPWAATGKAPGTGSGACHMRCTCPVRQTYAAIGAGLCPETRSAHRSSSHRQGAFQPPVVLCCEKEPWPPGLRTGAPGCGAHRAPHAPPRGGRVRHPWPIVGKVR